MPAALARVEAGSGSAVDGGVRNSSTLRPRNERQAARVSTVLFLAGAFLLTAYLVVEPTPSSTVGSAVAVPLLGGLLVFAALPHAVAHSRLTRWCVWPAMPVMGVVAIGALVLVYPDAENVAHPLLALPVLFAASQLRAPVAAAVTTMAIVVDGAFLLRTEERAEALTDLLFIGVVLVVMAMLLARAVDGQERLVRALERQAAVDSLTGLVTRRVLDDALSSALSASATDRGTALVLVDVDRFKSINDGHGHPVGDDALVHLAGVLTGVIRTTDAVVSRLGGDELAVLLPGCSAEVAARRAEDLVAAVRAAPLPLPDGRLLPLTVSVGVAHAPDHASELRDLYAAADAALYAAKRGGRDQSAVAPAPGAAEVAATSVCRPGCPDPTGPGGPRLYGRRDHHLAAQPPGARVPEARVPEARGPRPRPPAPLRGRAERAGGPCRRGPAAPLPAGAEQGRPLRAR